MALTHLYSAVVYAVAHESHFLAGKQAEMDDS